MNMIRDFLNNGSDLRLTGIFLTVFAVISAIASILTIVDKARAQNREWRIPENTLLITAALGGAPAMFLTMLVIRHKTKHRKFMVGLPIIILFQMIILLWCNYRFHLF